MKIPPADGLSLLQRSSSLSLATHSALIPGYPFVTVLPFATDSAHRPWLLMSDLAEHCRNVRADSRVSVLLQESGVPVLQSARMTLVGDVQAWQPDAATQARLLRYCPEFADYLALGDFHFFCLPPQRVRFIGGFGRMGWLDAADWAQLPELGAQDECEIVAQLMADFPALGILGVDCLGIDLQVGAVRQRRDFAATIAPDDVLAAARQQLAGA